MSQGVSTPDCRNIAVRQCFARQTDKRAHSAFGHLLAAKAEMHDIEEKLGDAAVPQEEHDALVDEGIPVARFPVPTGRLN